MAIPIAHEGNDVLFGVLEVCHFCRIQTQYWHENTNNPVCPSCAKTHKVAELPDCYLTGAKTSVQISAKPTRSHAMKPNQEFNCVNAACRSLGEHHPLCQAKSAPAEVAQGVLLEVVGVVAARDTGACDIYIPYVQFKTIVPPGVNLCRLSDAQAEVNELIELLRHARKHLAPSPDAELVKLLREIRCDLMAYIDAAYPPCLLSYPHNQRKHAADMEIVQRIDAKLASLKGEL
jgi:hypothetical protein